MRKLLTLVALLLALYGIAVLGYRELSEEKRKSVDDFWPTAISEQATQLLHVQPRTAQIALGVGVIFLLFMRRR